MIPAFKASGRPHMILPTIEKVDAVIGILILLLKLGIINNREILAEPALGMKTYYHEESDS